MKIVPVEYALYKGDEFIGLGTMKALSEAFGLSENTLRSCESRHKKKGIGVIVRADARVVIRIEEDEDEPDHENHKST